jgi:CheY-like chemotaxis protein
MRFLAVRAHDKGLELAYEIHPDVPDSLMGDPARLGQIIVNLVGNAIKFTEEGEVVLEVSCEWSTTEETMIRFAVSDTGVGIPGEKLGSIFDAFTQSDASTTRKYGGTGLGLAISARLSDKMDGRIWVESTAGSGSTFYFNARFKLRTEAVPDVAASDDSLLQGKRVLIVDDNATNRLILEEMARNWGMLPVTAHNAREALDLMRKTGQENRPCNLMVSDVNMPEVDGITLAEQVRKEPELANIPIILLTSGARPDDFERSASLTIAAVLPKPVAQSKLFDAISKCLGLTAETAEFDEVGHAKQERHLPPLQVLLVEDSLVNQKLATALLEKEGHNVVVAANGKEAVAACTSRELDVVLMDVEMPEMDGFEATRLIRESEKTSGRRLPIVAITAHASKGDRERCLRAGMDDYISKPIRPQQLFDAMEAVLTASRQAGGTN